MDWGIFIITGILILLNSFLTILLDKEKYKGIKLWLFIIIGGFAIFGLIWNFIIQKDESSRLRTEKDTLSAKLDTIDRKHNQLLQENTIFENELRKIKAQNDTINSQLRPFLNIALLKYPEFPNEVALKNLESYLVSSLAKITPYIKYSGFETNRYIGDKPYKLQTMFTFQALNGDNSDVNISINFQCIDCFAYHMFGGAVGFDQGTYLTEDTAKGGLKFHTDLLLNANYLYITVLSDDSLKSISVKIL